MKAYKYNLEQILKLKENMKNQLALEVSGLEKQEAEIQSRLDRLSHEWQRESDALAKDSHSLVAAEYQLRMSYLEHLNQKIEDERQNLLQISKHLANKRQKLLQYVREQNILEKIKERRRREFMRAERKREQKQIDELASLQYHNDQNQYSTPKDGK